MKPNTFIFADLSTYSPKDSMAFYKSVFGWTFYKDNDYYLAYNGNSPIAGLYETPDKFKTMGMPHFWMSYIQVNDIAQTVEKARSLGGIIEMQQGLGSFGKVALIRDPQGAGFTVYQGDQLQATRTENQANTLIWNELHISDAADIIPFYEGIFDWTFRKSSNDQFNIYSQDTTHIADTLVIPNAYKGKYEYWVCTFGVSNVKATQQLIIDLGGRLVSEEAQRSLMADPSGEAFFYIKQV